MKKIAVIFNPNSGSNSLSSTQIKELFGKHKKHVILFDIKKDMLKLKQNINTIDTLVAMGGDGTVNAVANLAATENMPMGVLPAGTLNHFAKDLKIPLDLKKAAKVILSNNLKKVDYCAVNDHIFINNSSVGLYPFQVSQRKKIEPKFGKRPAAVFATIKALILIRNKSYIVAVGKNSKKIRASMIFIGNNSYKFKKIGFSNREFLDKGQLFLYAIKTGKFTRLLQHSILAFFGKRIKNRDMLVLTDKTIRISSSQNSVKVSFDGEIKLLKYPLIYKIYPKGLSIYVPSK